MTASWAVGRSVGPAMEQKGKRTHGQGQQCGDCSAVEGVRGQNGNGKKYIIKMKLKNGKQTIALYDFGI